MCIVTSHSLARELLNKPDTFLTATDGEYEYVIENFTRIHTHANFDDEVTHLMLQLRKTEGGNIVR